jgi:cytoskeletal protein CcmA (bactofilin family)
MGQSGEMLQARNERPSLATAHATSPVSIAAGCSFEGLMTFRGATQVDGQLVGEVVATGTLRLGVTARVRARIEVDELIVEGELEGDVVARRRIELSATARVRGSIQAPRVSLAEGCLFQGRCRCVP